MITKNKSFESSLTLFLVATPIGNLKEMSPRALEVISNADIIAAEDTRNTKNLLSHYSIAKPLFSLREHNEKSASEQIVSYIKDGKKIVYVSDAGYPCISDPGYILVKECIANNIPVSTICGSSAFLNALCSSGLNPDHFYFHGFLSSKDSEAKKELESLLDKRETLIFYEAPHRIERTMEQLFLAFGDRKFVIGRELTKINEEFIRGTLAKYNEIEYPLVKGEIVIIVAGNEQIITKTDKEIEYHIDLLLKKGLSKKDVVELVSKIDNVNKNKVFDLVNK